MCGIADFETCPGQRFPATARLSFVVAVTSVTAVGKILTTTREKKFVIPLIQYKMNIHLNKFGGVKNIYIYIL